MSEPLAPALETFDAIYERELSYVWKTAGRLGVAAADIPDVVHDVFVVLYEQLGQLDRSRSLRPWLFGVARRIAANRRRRDRDVHDGDAVASTRGDADRIARRDLLWRLLGALDDDRLEVVVLHDLEGWSGADIASQLGISVNTVHSRLRLARADLAAALARLGRAPGPAGGK